MIPEAIDQMVSCKPNSKQLFKRRTFCQRAMLEENLILKKWGKK